MRGNPISRATSADGRWAYTLYDGGGRPFVHALDTTGQTARCIDVPAFPSNVDSWASRLRLAGGGTRLIVALAHRTLAVIDTRTPTVSEPAPAAGTHRRASHAQGSAFRQVLGFAGVAAILAAATAAAIRRRSGRPVARLDAP